MNPWKYVFRSRPNLPLEYEYNDGGRQESGRGLPGFNHDCVCRAISIALKSYFPECSKGKVYEHVFRTLRHRTEEHIAQFPAWKVNNLDFEDDPMVPYRVMDTVLPELGFRQISIPNGVATWEYLAEEYGSVLLGDHKQDRSKGPFISYVFISHMACILNGTLHDTDDWRHWEHFSSGNRAGNELPNCVNRRSDHKQESHRAYQLPMRREAYRIQDMLGIERPSNSQLRGRNILQS